MKLNIIGAKMLKKNLPTHVQAHIVKFHHQVKILNKIEKKNQQDNK